MSGPQCVSVAVWAQEARVLKHRCDAAEAGLAAAFDSLSSLGIPALMDDRDATLHHHNYYNSSGATSLTDPALGLVDGYRNSLAEHHLRASQVSSQLVAAKRCPERWLSCVKAEVEAQYAHGEDELRMIAGRCASSSSSHAAVDAALHESATLIAMLESTIENEALERLSALKTTSKRALSSSAHSSQRRTQTASSSISKSSLPSSLCMNQSPTTPKTGARHEAKLNVAEKADDGYSPESTGSNGLSLSPSPRNGERHVNHASRGRSSDSVARRGAARCSSTHSSATTVSIQRKPPVPQQRSASSAAVRAGKPSNTTVVTPGEAAVAAFDAFIKQFGGDKPMTLGWSEDDHAIFMRCVLQGDHTSTGRQLFTSHAPKTTLERGREHLCDADESAGGLQPISVPLPYGAYLQNQGGRGATKNYCRVEDRQQASDLMGASPYASEGDLSPSPSSIAVGMGVPVSAVESCMALLPHMTLDDVSRHLILYKEYVVLLAAKHEAIEAYRKQKTADDAQEQTIRALKAEHEAVHEQLAASAKERARLVRAQHNKMLVEEWRANKAASVAHTAKLIAAGIGSKYKDQYTGKTSTSVRSGIIQQMNSVPQCSRVVGGTTSTCSRTNDRSLDHVQTETGAFGNAVPQSARELAQYVHMSPNPNSNANRHALEDQHLNFLPPPPLQPVYHSTSVMAAMQQQQQEDVIMSEPFHNVSHQHSRQQQPVFRETFPMGSRFSYPYDASLAQQQHQQREEHEQQHNERQQQQMPPHPLDEHTTDHHGWSSPERRELFPSLSSASAITGGLGANYPHTLHYSPSPNEPASRGPQDHLAPSVALGHDNHSHDDHRFRSGYAPATLADLTLLTLEERLANVTNEAELQGLLSEFEEAEKRRASAERIAQRQVEIKQDVIEYKQLKAEAAEVKRAAEEAELRRKGYPVPPRGYRSSSSFAIGGGGERASSKAASTHFDPYNLHRRPRTRSSCDGESTGDSTMGYVPPSSYASLVPPPNPKETASPRMLQTWARDEEMVQRRRELSVLKEAKLKARENVPAVKPTAIKRPIVRDAGRLCAPTASARSRSQATQQQHTSVMEARDANRLTSFTAAGVHAHLGPVKWATGGVSR